MNAGRLSGMTFKHVDIDLPHLDRETIDGVRYYKIPDEEELIKLVSITSITSHYNKQIFIDWRKRVGTETADKITKAATSRGTCLLYTSPSPRDVSTSRMPSSA